MLTAIFGHIADIESRKPNATRPNQRLHLNKTVTEHFTIDESALPFSGIRADLNDLAVCTLSPLLSPSLLPGSPPHTCSSR
jgi:hypothetical protein